MIGDNWQDLGVIFSGSYDSRDPSVLGNGIVVFGDNAGHIFRSTDYGATWNDLGGILTDNSFSSSYLENGIVIMGSSVDMFRSTDYGVTWNNLGTISTSFILTSAYLGNGIAVFGDYFGHVFRSTDYGLTWSDMGQQFTYTPYTLSYLENGILTIGSSDGHIFRSTDYGITWDDLGNITNGVWNQSSSYIGNGIVVLGDGAGHVFRSTDYGITWDDLGIIASPYPEIRSMSYAGNGIVIFGDGAGHIHRSIDYGVTWTDLGMISANGLNSSSYLGNGVVMISNTEGHIFRSFPSQCISTPKYEGDNIHLGATPKDGIGPYSVEFTKTIDSKNTVLISYIDAPENIEITYDYTLTDEDIRKAFSGTIDFSVFISDSCPTGGQTCTETCTITIGCIAPVCNFTVT